jgi:hypothetical protein
MPVEMYGHSKSIINGTTLIESLIKTEGNETSPLFFEFITCFKNQSNFPQKKSKNSFYIG